MSFLDDLFDIGGSILNVVTGNNVVGAAVRAAGLGYLMTQTTETVTKENTVPAPAQEQNATTPDYGVREQVDPDTDHSIPVVYGTAFIGGIVSDAAMSSDNMTMYYCLTICEKTGDLLNGSPSTIYFDKVYWDNWEVVFNSDGYTVSKFKGDDGEELTDIAGKIKIWCFNNGSFSPTNVVGYANHGQQANSVMLNWTSQHTMDNLVFAIIRVDYDKAAGTTGLGNIEFKIRNTMTQAGDVLNDYLTNTRYGAGITPEEING